ncbi:MAG: hypothetical protein M3461_05240, partial [Pseudomonadota bacterium]|nr:hypothetical protein [Pseudomonadota bacterium]
MTPVRFANVRTENRLNFSGQRLRKVMPAGVEVTVVADRRFGDHKLYQFLDELGFGYVIRFRENIYVTDAQGERRLASEWV